MTAPSLSGKKWIFKRFNENDIRYIKENFSLDEITSKLLSKRKIKKDDINTFLNPSIKNFLPNPNILVDMEKSTERTLETIIKNEKIRAKKLGIKDFKKKYNINDMVKGDVIFCATGVTSGDLAKGVKDLGNEFEVTTFALHKSKKVNKIITNIYNK